MRRLPTALRLHFHPNGNSAHSALGSLWIAEQTYQTGADVYELFLTWALLGLPLAIVGQWGATSAAWVLASNTALLLFCGWNPRGGILWAVFDGNRFTTSDAILVAGALNLLLWFGFERLRRAGARLGAAAHSLLRLCIPDVGGRARRHRR